MFSRTNKTDYKFYLDYNKVLYFPSDKHLYIYKQLYDKYTTKAFRRYNNPHFINPQLYITIHSKITREYNKIFKSDGFKSDYVTNKDYIKYSNAYDFNIKHAKSIEAFTEMLNSACYKLYEPIRTNTKILIANCDAYLAKLFYTQKQIKNNKHKRTNEEETDNIYTDIEILPYNSIVDDLNIRFYTYNAPTNRNTHLLRRLCKNICLNKLNKYIRLLKDFIKIVYVKVVIYNKQFKLAIEMVLTSKIYNFGLGLKLSMRDCGLELN